jgi:hypothetical protein
MNQLAQVDIGRMTCGSFDPRDSQAQSPLHPFLYSSFLLCVRDGDGSEATFASAEG